ncbi:uncharacterized protein LOC141629666 [Silene latifolia]|uniref:uncharacterized protein LOC141629666 n=1 Tax=Silene latifolia TaxID=37657 RepID=UPI003D778DDA
MVDPEKTLWHSVVWNRLALPKHNFIAWLYAKERLLTKDRLIKHGLLIDGTCDICSSSNETREHLFFLCPFSNRCLQGLGEWLGVDIPDHDTLDWCRRLKMKSLMKKQLMIAAILALYYQVWWTRNKCRLEMMLPHPQSVIGQIQQLIRSVGNRRLWSVKHRVDSVWCTKVGISLQ